jgi:hypothetical protein
MGLALFLKLLKMSGSFIAEHWKVALAISLLLVAGLFVHSWNSRGEKIEALKVEVANERLRADKWQEASKLQSEKALEAARLRDEFERRLEEELAKPPKEIIRWRTVASDVPTVVDSAPDCGSAILDLGRLLKGAER